MASAGASDLPADPVPPVTSEGSAERWWVMDVPKSAAPPPLNLGADLPTWLFPVKREEEETDLDSASH